MTRITINGVSLDPVRQSRALAAAVPEVEDASRSNYVLVQTREPLSTDDQAALADLGCVVHEYVPDDTYLCGYASSDLAAIRSLPFVTWAGVYLRGFKVNPTLRPTAPDPSRSIVTVADHRPSRRTRTVDVVFHDDVEGTAASIVADVAAAAGLDPAVLHSSRGKIRITVEEGRLDRIAALDEVRHIEEVPRRQLFNNRARKIINAEVVVNDTTFQGEGQVVAVADTGFDEGSTTNVHPAFSGRVAKLYALGRPKPARADDPDGHGTHVAGSVLGDGNSASMGGPVQGTAPRATLVLQSTLDAAGELGGLPNDLHDLLEPPYENDGARVHTNSWGATNPGLPYDSSANEIDDFVWKHPDLVVVFAAGNDGSDANGNGIVDAGSIGSQSAAKNCITVGASENDRPDFDKTYGEYWPNDFPRDPVKTDLQADNPEGLVAFSSRGPTKERRIKPDVVAPGTSILSTLSRRVVTPSDAFGTSSDPLYFFESGTSMATPLVAGCVAVLRETLVKNGTPKPSAALVKALLINGASALAGQYSPTEAGASPNNDSGYGRVDLAGAVVIPGTTVGAGFREGGPLAHGQEERVTLTVPADATRLKVTLVWSDPPGPALQNDLDLIVRVGNAAERHGNMGTAAGFDRVNNVEQVLWDGVASGTVDLVVRAFRITRFPQPFAVVWRFS